MAQHKLLFALFVLSILFFPGCSQNAQVTDTNPKVTQSESSDTALTDDERCTKYDTRESMLYKEARDLAEKSACAIEGKLKSTHWCNTATGTWEIDTTIEKAGCMPTCLINVVTKETEINWKCTGAKDTNQITTTSTTDEWKVLGTIGPDRPQEDSSPVYNMSYTPEEGPKGAFLLELKDDWFNSDIDGYKFKIDHFLYASEYTVRGAVIDVMRPDGTIVQARFGFDECHNTYYDAQVDDIVLRLQSASPLQTWKAKVYVWNYKTTPVIQKQMPYEKPNPNAKLLEGVNEGFTTEYNGYKFKIDSLKYSRDYHPSSIVLDVQRPDGTIKEVTVTEGSNAKVDDINIASPFCGTVEESATIQTAVLWVW